MCTHLVVVIVLARDAVYGQRLANTTKKKWALVPTNVRSCAREKILCERFAKASDRP
jgi:hypothetical protein